MRSWFWLTFIVFIVAACGGAGKETPLAVSTPTQVATPTEAVPVTAEAATAPPDKATSPAEVVDWLAVEGKTADNLFYQGNPDAPVTLIDYSDFL
ncbi:MAG: hypothetical protein HC875_32665 [Anaerolineales bacterium]|nr:hypothetical protein [Anaerolineales bacterium]